MCRLIEHFYCLRLIGFNSYICVFQSEDMPQYVDAADKLVAIFKNDAVVV